MKKLLTFVFVLLALSVSVFAAKVERMTLDTNSSYMGGYPDATFRPDGTITRAEAVTVFSRLLYKEGVPDGKSSFSDVSGHWSESGVACLEALGALGIFDEKFLPDTPITRAEFVALATFVFNCERVKNVSFSDVDESHPFYPSITLAGESALVGG